MKLTCSPLAWDQRLVACAITLVCAAGWARGDDDPAPSYKNYKDPRGPKSIHVVRIPRAGGNFQLMSVHATGRAVGLSTVGDQAAAAGRSHTVVAAINGDFYQRRGPYAGDPRGLQVSEGELLSAPVGTDTFWVDAAGEPHVTNTTSLFRVTWPDGSKRVFGLNGTRQANSLELYTPAAGVSTHTAGGRELVLEQTTNSQWLPLRPNRVYRARIREIQERGDTRIPPGCLVLSIGPSLARTKPPPVTVGAELTLSTEIEPSLRGARTALSGGPVLVRDGKRVRIQLTEEESDSFRGSSMFERHPRSAIGWNDDAYFLVAVDGRNRNSVGMTLSEFSAFLIELGCQGALNLDGGGSSTLWFEGRIRNRLCDGEERDIANALIVVKGKPQSGPSAGEGAAAAK